MILNRRFTGIIIAIAVCGLYISCASASYSVSKPSRTPEDFFGITPERSPLNKEDFELLDEFNAVWIRNTIRWSNVEALEGVWDFEYWDAYVEKAEEANKKIVFVLGFDNRRLYSDNREHRAFTSQELPYFLNYVEQVVSRYRTRVVYEIWNEPNVIYWKGTSEQFYRLSAETARKIRELEPEALILAGATFRVSKRFIRGMFSSGAMENTDGISVHPYATTPIATIKQINKLYKILDEFGYGKPVWITEVGYFTGPSLVFKIKHYPEYIVKTLSSLAIRGDRIRNLIWYELMDEYNPGEVKNRLNPLNYMGLIYPDKNFKPGAETYMLSAGYIAGADYNPEFPIRDGIQKKVTSLYFTKQDGTSIIILWIDGSGKKKLRLAVPGAEYVSVHNIYNREINLLPAETVLEISRNPLFITWTGGGLPRLFNIDD